MLNASGGKVEEASWNHKSSAWSIELLRAVLAKDGQQTTTAEEAVLSAYFPRELGIGSAGVGLWGPEQGAPDPHGGQELVGVSLVLCAALLLDAHGDASLLEGARQLVAANAEYLLSMATNAPDLTVHMPGFRAPDHNITSFVASSWLRELTGNPQQRDLAQCDSPDWSFPNYLAVRALRSIRNRWPSEAATWSEITPSPVKVKFPVDVWRWAGGFQAVLRDAPDGPENVLWAKVDGNSLSSGGSLDNVPVLPKSSPPPSLLQHPSLS
jgi:hypothetical protein